MANGKIDTGTLGFRWINGGDTQGIAALPDGSFAVAGVQSAGGRPSLWFWRIAPR